MIIEISFSQLKSWRFSNYYQRVSEDLKTSLSVPLTNSKIFFRTFLKSLVNFVFLGVKLLPIADQENRRPIQGKMVIQSADEEIRRRVV